MFIVDIFYRLYYGIRTLPLPIIIVLVVAFVNVVLVLISVAVVFFKRKNRDKKISLKEKYGDDVRALFMKILSGKQDYSRRQVIEEYEDIVGDLKDDKIELAKDILIDLKSHSGDTHQYDMSRFSIVADALGVDSYLSKKLRYASGPDRHKIMSEASFLQLADFNQIFIRNSYSRDEEIKSLSKTSLLSTGDNPYAYFDDVKEKDDYFDWDEIHLMNILKQHHKEGRLPQLSRWVVYATNTPLLIFLIRAIGYFKQTEATDLIASKLNDRNERIREVAIIALAHLDAYQYEQKLVQIFASETRLCQRAVIKAIGILNTGKSLDFLNETYLTTTDVELEKDIAEVIYKYKGGGNEAFDKLTSEISEGGKVDKETDSSSPILMAAGLNPKQYLHFRKKRILGHCATDLIKYK